MKRSRFIRSALLAAAATIAFGGTAQADIYALVDRANAQLATDGKAYRIGVAEYITNGEANQLGRTLFFSDRGNRRFAYDFVPADPRRIAGGWADAGTGITFAIDDAQQTLDIAGDAELGEMRAAVQIWDNVNCSHIPLVDRGNTGVDVGLTQLIFGGGGTGGIAADIQYAGFLPGSFFRFMAGTENNDIIAVTFTVIWVDGSGNDTDIDNNGVGDVAFRETYFNDGVLWVIDPTDQATDRDFDIQTVALHEFGHGLSQNHFGDAFMTKNGHLQVAPRAVMNSAYFQAQRELAGTDIGGHCNNWSAWPMR